MDSPVSISVVIPAFNSADTLARAIDSARSQTYPLTEIIVADDGSTDATRTIAEGYGDAVKLISLPERRGAAGARNAGVAAARGEAIAFLDSDDEWLPTKLAAQVPVLKSSPLISFVACAASLTSAKGIDLGDIYHKHPVVTGPDAWRALLAYNFIATPTVLVWRDKILAVGGFDEKLKIGEDQDLWIRLSLIGHLGYAPETLVKVHVRENSLSSDRSDPLIYTIPMIEKHLSTLQSRLSNADVRQIRGKRLGLVGRVAYAHGDYSNGLRLIGRSMALGYQPLQSLYYMASASPPATWVKKIFGLGRQP
jgi:glycosyltransferase involved in cell wall biosynthesis